MIYRNEDSKATIKIVQTPLEINGLKNMVLKELDITNVIIKLTTKQPLEPEPVVKTLILGDVKDIHGQTEFYRIRTKDLLEGCSNRKHKFDQTQVDNSNPALIWFQSYLRRVAPEWCYIQKGYANLL